MAFATNAEFLRKAVSPCCRESGGVSAVLACCPCCRCF